MLNEVNPDTVQTLQRCALEESRLGIPLLFGRDVIHGFRTVLPIPLGLAATFNPELVRQGARIAALEAAAAGINWTFAPMIDISRDPRWGRIAESFGEDPYLTGVMARAMVEGFQGDDLSLPGSLAACAKHFAGYGASEGGRDYDTTSIPEHELRNVHLPPFREAVDAGVATLMTSFSDLNGIPATGNRFLLTQVLRNEWRFDGFVVSDWAAIEQLTAHGLTANDRQAAYEAFHAGVNMEMATSVYAGNLPDLLARGEVSEEMLNARVADILRVKMRLGLFDRPPGQAAELPPLQEHEAREVAREAAVQSIVLLENRRQVLPLKADRLKNLAVIGPMADDPYEQMGTWVFDGDPTLSQTPLQAIREAVGQDVEVSFIKALETTRSRDTGAWDEALRVARAADVVLLFLGEEAILSGEAHSRADIGLPGAQAELVAMLKQAGKPMVVTILAGRPLTLGSMPEDVDALLFAWHPGSMGGPAIADVLFGRVSPSGKLPVTFPRVVGQVPIYYAHKNTGKPATPETFMHMDDIPVRMPQYQSRFVSCYIDAGYEPRYPFGYGLSYGRFVYSDLNVSNREVQQGQPVQLQVTVTNEGAMAAEEVVQIYIRDLAAQVTRPVRELKRFRRLRLASGESRTLSFRLEPDDLSFYGRDMTLTLEPGTFHVWIGGSSTAGLQAEFSLVAAPPAAAEAS